MDEVSRAWSLLQAARGQVAIAEEMLTATLPQHRTARHRKVVARVQREMAERMRHYQEVTSPTPAVEPDAYALCEWGDTRGCNGEDLTPEVAMREVRDGDNVELVCAKCWALGLADAEDEAERPLCREDEGCV
jgi:hypothetical protein